MYLLVMDPGSFFLAHLLLPLEAGNYPVPNHVNFQHLLDFPRFDEHADTLWNGHQQAGLLVAQVQEYNDRRSAPVTT